MNAIEWWMRRFSFWERWLIVLVASFFFTVNVINIERGFGYRGYGWPMEIVGIGTFAGGFRPVGLIVNLMVLGVISLVAVHCMRYLARRSKAFEGYAPEPKILIAGTTIQVAMMIVFLVTMFAEVSGFYSVMGFMYGVVLGVAVSHLASYPFVRTGAQTNWLKFFVICFIVLLGVHIPSHAWMFFQPYRWIDYLSQMSLLIAPAFAIFACCFLFYFARALFSFWIVLPGHEVPVGKGNVSIASLMLLTVFFALMMVGIRLIPTYFLATLDVETQTRYTIYLPLQFFVWTLSTFTMFLSAGYLASGGRRWIGVLAIVASCLMTYGLYLVNLSIVESGMPMESPGKYLADAVLTTVIHLSIFRIWKDAGCQLAFWNVFSNQVTTTSQSGVALEDMTASDAQLG